MLDSHFEERLQAVGVDTATAIARFAGNAALYAKFLSKFPQDPNFADLESALHEHDVEKAIRCAHTLKGVCGNLGMDTLFRGFSEMVSHLRGDEFERAETLFPRIAENYAAVCTAIAES